MTRTKKAPTPPEPSAPASNHAPDDWNENTPPPRVRPQGTPIPGWVPLTPGEEAAVNFAAWDKAGRVPAGSVLAEFTGTACGPTRSTGYRLAVGKLAGIAVGASIPLSTLDGLRIVSNVVEQLKGRRSFVVMAPVEVGR